MQFMVRTEMHQASEEMYQSLHSRMAAQSFSRLLTHSVTGQKYQMPTGTYWTEAYATSAEAMEAAVRAASVVDPNVSITVSGGAEPIRFYNCPVVQDNLAGLLSLLSPPKLAAKPDPVNFLSGLFAAPTSPSTVPVPNTLGSSFWESMLKAK